MADITVAGNPPSHGLRDPAVDEKRVMFVCNVDRIATFGKPKPLPETRHGVLSS